MTSTGQHYLAQHADLTALAATLTGAETATAVPALPGWTVHDVCSHLTGVCADVLDGRIGDPHDTDWTARQVDARRDRPLDEVLAEWTRRAPDLAELMDTPIGRPAVFCVFDLFHHTHDVRGALDRPGGRDGDTAAFVAATMAKLHRKPWQARGLPAIVLSTPSGSWQLGDGEPAAALHTTDFELSRLLIGRRSRAQMLAAPWTGDPEPILDHLPTFGPPAEDLIE